MRNLLLATVFAGLSTGAFAQMPSQQQSDPAQESVALSYRQLGLSLNELIKSEQEKVNSLQQKIHDLNTYWANYTATSPKPLTSK